MGGEGSGRWYRYASRDTVDGLHSLDVNWLKRNAYLSPGRMSSVQWRRGDQETGNICIRAGEVHLVLDYRYKARDGEWEGVLETVFLSWTRCNYGGQRPWFICPGVRNGVACQRRVAKLYLAGKYFLCRHCHDLAYESQREPARDRLMRKAQDIRRRLGGSVSLADPFPAKPKGDALGYLPEAVAEGE